MSTSGNGGELTPHKRNDLRLATIILGLWVSVVIGILVWLYFSEKT
jgi:hypothetical protein